MGKSADFQGELVTGDSLLLIDGVRVLVVCLGHTLPFAIEFEQQKEVGEVDGATPPLFKNADDRHGLLDCQHIYSGFELSSCSNSIDIVVELLYGAALDGAVLFAYSLLPSATLFTNFSAARATASYSLILSRIILYIYLII